MMVSNQQFRKTQNADSGDSAAVEKSTAPSFTPGPWTVILRGERGTFHIVEAQKHEAQNADDGVDGYTVSKANARLIAAAPEIFEALLIAQAMLLDATNVPPCGDNCWGIIAGAIEKAGGAGISLLLNKHKALAKAAVRP